MVNPPMNDTREVGLEYRKTATIRAVQWFKPGDHPAVEPYADQLGVIKGLGPYGWCPTLEGGHVVTPGDWIATGIKGERWPIKPDVFAATYEPVSFPPEGGAEPDDEIQRQRQIIETWRKAYIKATGSDQ